jgi:pimeloyl-ACP methyl ester carboxylesterase
MSELFEVRCGARSWAVRQWAAAPGRGHPARGLPLLALHGFTGSGADFAPLAAALGRAVIAPDLPGHGGTSGPPLGVAACADALALLLTRLSLRRVDLLGYSLGGRTAPPPSGTSGSPGSRTR